MSTIESTGLSISELRELAEEVLADRESWEPLVRATTADRHQQLLRQDELVAVWVSSWRNGHDTGYHDHDVASGAVAVAEGSVREERLRVGGAPESRVFAAGDVLAFEGSDIHKLSHLAGEPAVTIHVYSPPPERHGAYVFEPTGSLRRRSVPADAELRPQAVYGRVAAIS